ncbi:O-sialoglycoprotein endopeptidase [Peptoniphilus sp. ING2-D1G]|nr:O-sialoglycoprotein endopeptidase [Peptoniphilus sp. ING2-D1G]
MIVLGIDTSTMRTSVGLIKDEEEIASFEITSSVNNSEDLTDMIADIFNKLDIRIQDIDLIGVGVGPGSYTGTRIAVTVARVLAQTLDKKIKAVSSLKSLSYHYEGDRVILSILDARRARGYYGIYKNNSGNIKTVKEDSVDDFEHIKKELSGQKVVILGKDSEKLIDCFKSDIDIIKLSNCQIKGSYIAKLALEEFKNSGEDEIEEVLPNYINKSQAEREYEKRKNNN